MDYGMSYKSSTYWERTVVHWNLLGLFSQLKKHLVSGKKVDNVRIQLRNFFGGFLFKTKTHRHFCQNFCAMITTSQNQIVRNIWGEQRSRLQQKDSENRLTSLFVSHTSLRLDCVPNKHSKLEKSGVNGVNETKNKSEMRPETNYQGALLRYFGIWLFIWHLYDWTRKVAHSKLKLQRIGSQDIDL